LYITVYGRTDDILAAIDGRSYDANRFVIVEAPEVIGNEESPVSAIRSKKDSSIVKAMRSVVEGHADGFVSAGSTGAVLAGGTFIIKRIRGIHRPALAPVMPSSKEGFLLIDCGANVDSKPEYLAQFGVMGSIYMQQVFHMKNPRVGLVNNGAEEGKGNELVKQAAPLLRQMPINYQGNVEAREITSGDYDVIVADGFVGNVILKLMEGMAATIFDMLKVQMSSGLRNKLGAALLMPALRKFKKQMDYTEYGGAPLLGLEAAVVKAHGSSNQKAFYHAIRQCKEMVEGDIVNRIKTDIEGLDLTSATE
ncbi:phosphate acyltransferase PlsX, partial [Eubacteriales bacterium OttesenSCG-928-N14]|nr:phosphate acyltransferase PlsX [Eubacteriales bacterium OttesenSCG-928-N14]